MSSAFNVFGDFVCIIINFSTAPHINNNKRSNVFINFPKNETFTL